MISEELTAKLLILKHQSRKLTVFMGFLLLQLGNVLCPHKIKYKDDQNTSFCVWLLTFAWIKLSLLKASQTSLPEVHQKIFSFITFPLRPYNLPNRMNSLQDRMALYEAALICRRFRAYTSLASVVCRISCLMVSSHLCNFEAKQDQTSRVTNFKCRGDGSCMKSTKDKNAGNASNLPHPKGF